MPVKRRSAKRRLTPEAELAAWQDTFETGFDFFGDVSAITGLVEPVNVWPLDARGEAEAAWRAAAREAWHRLGALFVAQHGGDCWALSRFGAPSCR